MYFIVLWISYMYFFFFFFFWGGGICRRHFLKRINAKNNLISAIESENKHIIWTKWFLLLLHWLSLFGPTCMYKKLRNFGTVPLGVTNLVSKCAENSKKKTNKRETWKKIVTKYRGESIARCGVIARNVKGGHHAPSLFRVKVSVHFWNIYLLVNPLFVLLCLSITVQIINCNYVFIM